MKAEELRIGNWVEWEDDSHEQVQVNSIIKGKGLTGNNWFVNGGIIEDFLPIPLTEEWLLKLGFEKVESKNEFDKDAYSHPTTSSTGRALPFFIERCLNGTYSPVFYMDIHEEIKYVHQLQNLFYSLTGKELTINK